MRKYAILLSLLFIVNGSCSGPTTSAQSSLDPDQGNAFSFSVAAEEGGTLTTRSGRVTITIPPYALLTSQTITIEVLAPDPQTVANVYDLKPDGLEFFSPATLQIEYDGTLAPNQQVVIATETANGWEPAQDSVYVNGTVQAQIDHFSPWSLAVVEIPAYNASRSRSPDTGWRLAWLTPTVND